MTDRPTVIDAEVEETVDTVVESSDTPATRPFRVVTHKPGLVAVLSRFGATQDVGISVDTAAAADTLWWMPQDWAVQVLRAGIDLPQLTAPTPGWLAKLPQRFLNRQVGTLRKCDIPRYYAKHPQAVEEHPRVVLSPPGENTDLLPPAVVDAVDLAAAELPPGYADLPENTLLQIDQMLPCVVEVRVWVANGEVAAHAPYRLGMVGWDSGLFLEMLFNAEGQALIQGALDAAQVIAREVDGPPGYALDLGVTVDGTVTVLRVWPAWAADPLHAEPVGVMAALIAAHDFDGVDYEWRWTPDLNLYHRGVAAPADDADPEIAADPAASLPPTDSDEEEPTDD